MSVFQRRLASSTYALLRSFERRQQKLSLLIEAMRSGKLNPAKLGLFRSFGDESPSTEHMENLHLQKPRLLLRDHSSARPESVSFAAG
jgi:hypothetical protein